MAVVRAAALRGGAAGATGHAFVWLSGPAATTPGVARPAAGRALAAWQVECREEQWPVAGQERHYPEARLEQQIERAQRQQEVDDTHPADAQPIEHLRQ